MDTIPADNLYRGLTRDEFVDSAAKQLAGMVFDLWLEHVSQEEKRATLIQEKKEDVV